jgi:hypothetical protein
MGRKFWTKYLICRIQSSKLATSPTPSLTVLAFSKSNSLETNAFSIARPWWEKEIETKRTYNGPPFQRRNLPFMSKLITIDRLFTEDPSLFTKHCHGTLSLSGTVLDRFIPLIRAMRIHVYLGYSMICLVLFATFVSSRSTDTCAFSMNRNTARGSRLRSCALVTQ